jgi:hypothetical protein
MATVQAILASTWPRDVKATDIAICSLIHFYVHGDPLNRSGELLNRLITHTTRLIFLVDARPTTFTDFLKSLQACLQGTRNEEELNDVDEDIRSIVKIVASSLSNLASFSGLHAFFARTERLLLREEMFDEMQNMTINPAERQIDDSSPFGVHLQFCLESYLALEDDGFARLVRGLDRWLRMGVLGEVVEDEENVFDVSPEEEVEQALRQGDYSTARSGLEGSFDRAPLATMNRSLPATLLHTARFHLSTYALDAAKTALHEALKLARGTNDVQCIAACDELLQEIKYEVDKGKTKPSYRPSSSGRYKNLREAVNDKERGLPLLSLVGSLEQFQSARFNTIKSETPLQYLEGPSDSVCVRQELLLSGLWSSVGCPRLARTLLDYSEDEAALAVGWQSRQNYLEITLKRAELLSLSSQFEHALALLVDSDLLCNLDVNMLQQWHGEILRTLYRSALASGATEAMLQIARLRPEVKREIGCLSDRATKSLNGHKKTLPNEASFMRSKHANYEQSLRLRLHQARELREAANDGINALLMASGVMNEAEQADLLTVYREAVYEVAEANFSIGQHEHGRYLLEGIMLQVSCQLSLRIVLHTYSNLVLGYECIDTDHRRQGVLAICSCHTSSPRPRER